MTLGQETTRAYSLQCSWAHTGWICWKEC